jgi:uncharacterized protein YndB with AHSA1/START domain
MSYNPAPADATITSKEGDLWTLVLVRELRHSPDRVWQALTDPEQLKEWCPFDADKTLTQGAVVTLSTVGAPKEYVTETRITRAEEPHFLEYSWGGNDVRWQLEPQGQGTRLTLWASINRNFVAMGAAGWHLCLDVLARLLDGDPLGRHVGPDALQYEPWQRLHTEYMARFGVEAPKW